jgi:hypothetical protein
LFRIVRIVGFGFGLLGGLVASQGPEYSQQYRQRLGGAIDELRRIIGQFDLDAQANGESRDSAITRLRGQTDALASRQGAAMQGNVERLSRLEQQRRAMTEAGSFGRILVMLRTGDADVMRAAYGDFEPAVPVTQEGIVSAAAGFILLWGGFLLLAWLLRSLVRRPRRHRRTLRLEA